MQTITTAVKKTIAYLAKKSAGMETNTACPFISKEGIISDEEKEIVRFGLESLEGNLLGIILTLIIGIVSVNAGCRISGFFNI